MRCYTTMIKTKSSLQLCEKDTSRSSTDNPKHWYTRDSIDGSRRQCQTFVDICYIFTCSHRRKVILK